MARGCWSRGEKKGVIDVIDQQMGPVVVAGRSQKNALLKHARVSSPSSGRGPYFRFRFCPVYCGSFTFGTHLRRLVRARRLASRAPNTTSPSLPFAPAPHRITRRERRTSRRSRFFHLPPRVHRTSLARLSNFDPAIRTTANLSILCHLGDTPGAASPRVWSSSVPSSSQHSALSTQYSELGTLAVRVAGACTVLLHQIGHHGGFDMTRARRILTCAPRCEQRAAGRPRRTAEACAAGRSRGYPSRVQAPSRSQL